MPKNILDYRYVKYEKSELFANLIEIKITVYESASMEFYQIVNSKNNFKNSFDCNGILGPIPWDETPGLICDAGIGLERIEINRGDLDKWHLDFHWDKRNYKCWSW